MFEGGFWVVDKTKLVMDEPGLHSQSNTSPEPDFLYTKFCLIQIVTLSSGHYITPKRRYINLWMVQYSPLIMLDCSSLSADLFINPIQLAESHFPQCIILNFLYI